MINALQVIDQISVAALTASSSRQALPNGEYLRICVNEVASGTGVWVKLGDNNVTAAVGTANTVAAATLTSTGVFSGAETVTIGSRTYTFRAALTPTAGEVLIGANQTASHLNLLSAVNGTGTAGTDYASGTALHPTITAVSSDGTHTVFNAKTPGAAGNALVSTETCANASFGGAVFASGADGVATSIFVPLREVLMIRRQPNQTHIAAIGVGANSILSVTGLS